jgi:large subunit ribosomal protein L2
MGKRIITQKRGKGSQRYVAPSHRYKTEAHYAQGERSGVVEDIQHDLSKTGIVMRVGWDDGRKNMYLAPEGMMTGDRVVQGGSGIALGNVLALTSVPEGMPIFNIEARPGDGGRVVRASGAGAYIVAKKGNVVVIRLPSRQVKPFSANCRATIGVSAGGGRLEKPLVKAGNAWKKHREIGRASCRERV